MTDTRDALMRAILVDPADDTVRLAYADHCRENGDDARADFIETQITLDAIGDFDFTERNKDLGHRCYADTERERFRKHERELFDRFKTQWFDERAAIYYLPHESEDAEGQYPDLKRAVVSRGFVSSVSFSLVDWVGTPEYAERFNHNSPVVSRVLVGMNGGHGPRIVAEQPVERVEVTDASWVERAGMFSSHIDLPNVGRSVVDPKILAMRPDEASARKALSDWLVNWARREAGLPPLEERQ